MFLYGLVDETQVSLIVMRKHCADLDDKLISIR